jgi:acetyl-CoA carboxylase carboxyltransferase component
MAGKADFVVMVKGCCMAVSGPRVLEIAMGEKITPEELGGWKLHAEVTGQVDAFAEDDEDCLRIVRGFLSYMPSNCDEEPPYVVTQDPPDRKVNEWQDCRNHSQPAFVLCWGRRARCL